MDQIYCGCEGTAQDRERRSLRQNERQEKEKRRLCKRQGYDTDQSTPFTQVTKPLGPRMRVNAVRIDGIVGTDGISHPAKPGDERPIIRHNNPATLSSVAVGIGRDICDRESRTYHKRE